jgi:hypothetical protein
MIVGDRFGYNGKAFYPVCDTAWMLLELSDADIKSYLTKRKAHGFNCTMFGATTANAFKGSVKRPDAAWFAKLTRTLKVMDGMGLWAVVVAGPIYDYAPAGIRVLPKPEWREAGRYVGNILNGQALEPLGVNLMVYFLQQELILFKKIQH